MSQPLQSKLLRVLQDGKFRRVGDTRTREANVRIIAAMNQDPFEAIESGQLRRDLFYRLNTITLRLSRLAERPEDIEVLARHFIDKYSKKYAKKITGLSAETEKLLLDFHWPGNVRELEHVIESAISMIDGEVITPYDIPSYLKNRQQQRVIVNYNLRDRILDLESELIEQAMAVSDGNISRAAKLLSIPRQTLQYKLKKGGAE
jgi:arginine utilization regulatory protein